MWKAIEDNPVYEISEQGEVRNSETGRILKQQERGSYLRVALVVDEKRKTFSIHRLVAQTFIPNPENKPFVNHIDFNTKNNNFENLEWVTRKENDEHRWSGEHGEFHRERLRKNIDALVTPNKKPVQALNSQKEVVAEYESMSEAERVTGINRKSIRYCLQGKRTTAGGFYWREI